MGECVLSSEQIIIRVNKQRPPRLPKKVTRQYDNSKAQKLLANSHRDLQPQRHCGCRRYDFRTKYRFRYLRVALCAMTMRSVARTTFSFLCYASLLDAWGPPTKIIITSSDFLADYGNVHTNMCTVDSLRPACMLAKGLPKNWLCLEFLFALIRRLSPREFRENIPTRKRKRKEKRGKRKSQPPPRQNQKLDVSPAIHLLPLVRGTATSPSASTSQTPSEHLCRAPTLFFPSLLSEAVQTAIDIDTFSHNMLISFPLPTVGRYSFNLLLIYQQYFTTCSLQL